MKGRGNPIEKFAQGVETEDSTILHRKTHGTPEQRTGFHHPRPNKLPTTDHRHRGGDQRIILHVGHT